jgi:hypothetical protein
MSVFEKQNRDKEANPDNKVRVTLIIEEDILDKLRKLSFKNNIKYSLSNVLRNIIAKFVEDEIKKED